MFVQTPIGDEILDFFSITTTMVGNMPFPWFFMPTPGEPSTPFKMWRQIFDNYLLVIGGILGQMHIVGAYCYTALAPKVPCLLAPGYWNLLQHSNDGVDELLRAQD